MRKKNIKRRKKNLNEISPGIGALAGTGLGGAVSAGANYYIYRKKIKELENKKNECGGSRYCEETIQKKINDLKANLKYSLLKTGLTGAAFGALGGFGLSALGNKKPVSPTATQQTIQPNTQNTTQQPSNSNVPPSVQDVKTDGTTVNTQQQPKSVPDIQSYTTQASYYPGYSSYYGGMYGGYGQPVSSGGFLSSVGRVASLLPTLSYSLSSVTPMISMLRSSDGGMGMVPSSSYVGMNPVASQLASTEEEIKKILERRKKRMEKEKKSSEQNTTQNTTERNYEEDDEKLKDVKNEIETVKESYNKKINKILFENILLDSEKKYIFQFPVYVIRNKEEVEDDEVEEKLDWIKENYKKLIKHCYIEVKNYSDISDLEMNFSSFAEIIYPLYIKFYKPDKNLFSLSFKIDNLEKYESITLLFNDKNELLKTFIF